MNSRASKIRKFLGSTQILVSILFIVSAIAVTQKSELLNNIYTGKQLASVATGANGCYTQSDVDGLMAQKTSLEAQRLYIYNQLSDVDSKINSTTNEIDANTIELENLKNSLIPEDRLVAQKTEIDTVERKLARLKTSSGDSGVCSVDGYYDKFSCENAGEYVDSYCSDKSHTDELSCVNAGISYQGYCSGGAYYDKHSCEGAGYDYWGYGPGSSIEYCSNSSYYDESSCTNAGYYSGGGCSNSNYYDEYSCVNAGYFDQGTCSASWYYDQSSCENAGSSPAYCTGGWGYYDKQSCESAGVSAGYCSNGYFGDESSCTQAQCITTPASCSDNSYSTYDDCVNNGYVWSSEISGSCGYTWTPGSMGYGYTWVERYPGYGYTWTPSQYVNYGYTWTPPTFTSYNYTWNQSWYSYWTNWFTNYGYTWIEPAFVSSGNQWTPGQFNSYGYTWIPTDFETEEKNLTNKLASLSDEYMQSLEQNSTVYASISVAEKTSTTLSNTLREQVTLKASIKADFVNLELQMESLAHDLNTSQSNICQAEDTTVSNDIVGNILNILGEDRSANISDDANFIPIETSVPPSFISDRSLSISNLLKNNISLLKQQNETSIIPAMKQIEDKAAIGAYDELPDLMEKAEKQIDNAQLAVDRSITDSSLLKEENEISTSDSDVKTQINQYVDAVKIYLEKYDDYFNILKKFLVQSMPTPELYSSLNQSISALGTSGEEYSARVSRLTSTIDSKNAIRDKVVSVVSFTPASGSYISHMNFIDKISIEFNKPIEKYLGGTINIRYSDISDTRVFETAILLINSGDTSISASIPQLSAGNTYTVDADIQLQFAGKAYSLKSMDKWKFTIEGNSAGVTFKTVEEKEEEENTGLSEEEKCVEKKGFWSRLFGGKCKPAPDICCVCAYGNLNTKLSFEASCDREMMANACTKSTKVYAPTNKAVDKVIENFPNSCPSDQYDDVRLFYEKHGDPTGEEQRFCRDLPMQIIESYEKNNMPVPAHITLNHGQCSGFNDVSEARSWVNSLSNRLADEGYVNIKITISGNQEPKMNAYYDAIGGYLGQKYVAVEDENAGGTIKYCPGETKFEVCSTAVKVDLPSCPEVGSPCPYGFDDNSVMECKNIFGFESSRQCVSDDTPPDGVWTR